MAKSQKLPKHHSYSSSTQRGTLDRQPARYSVALKASETGLLSPQELTDAAKTMSEDQYLQEFECSAAIQGAYFASQMRRAREEGRIGKLPLDPARPVNTFWDIGKNDSTAIWFH